MSDTSTMSPREARAKVAAARGTAGRETGPMADTAVDETTDAPPAEDAPAPEPEAAPVEETVADDDPTGTVYVVGYVGDGEENPILAATDDPEDDTEVWLAANPAERTTLSMFDDQYADTQGVYWDAEPLPYTGSGPAPQAARVAAAGSATALLDEAEARLAAAEGQVAALILDNLRDERFLDDDSDNPDPSDDGPVGEQPPATAPVASATQEFLDRRARVAAVATAAEDEMEDDAGPGDATDEVAGEGDPDDVAAQDDIGERVADLFERLDTLEATVAELQIDSVPDEELLDEDEVRQATIDERDDED